MAPTGGCPPGGCAGEPELFGHPCFGAWSAPVVALAVAAPAAAASDQARVTVFWSPDAITIGSAVATLTLVNTSLVEASGLTLAISGTRSGLYVGSSGDEWRDVPRLSTENRVVFTRPNPLQSGQTSNLRFDFIADLLPPGEYPLTTSVLAGASGNTAVLRVTAV